MSCESTISVQGVVFDTVDQAAKHGHGGICYDWKLGSSRQFPEDVQQVLIVMPLDWEGEENKGKGVLIGWAVAEENHCGAKWKLSGTHQKPTLSPSLHWVGMWHGWLQDGFLRSC